MQKKFVKPPLDITKDLGIDPQKTAGDVKGNMDVIALHAAGIERAVAPLGTALTEHQSQELWKYAPEPILCFDGDKAGQRAAIRAAKRSLPLLTVDLIDKLLLVFQIQMKEKQY